MYDALGLTGGIGDDERGDLFLFHEGERRGGEGAAIDGEGVGIHDLACGAVKCVGAVVLEEATEVTVRDHAEETAVLQDGGHAEFFAGHFVDDLRHGRVGGDLRESVACVHELSDAGETSADASAGMEVGEVFGLPASATAYFESECVAEREHDGG